MRQPDPENGAVLVATNDEDEQTIELAGEIKNIVTPGRKLPDPRVFIPAEAACPFACSAEPGRCAWNCAPLSVRDSEVTS